MNATTTVRESLAALDAERAKALRAIETRAAVLALLPLDIQTPTISNVNPDAWFGQGGAWLSWRLSYGASQQAADTAKERGAAILEALEAAGFEPMPVTLCQWGNYRRVPEPGAQEDIPDYKRGDSLNDSDPLAPIWIRHDGVTPNRAEVCTFYRRDHAVFKVSIELPDLCVGLTARRIEGRGAWRYDPQQTPQFVYPHEWRALTVDMGGLQGIPVAGVLTRHSRGWIDTEQSLSGAVYFEPHAEPFPLTPSAFLRVIMAA